MANTFTSEQRAAIDAQGKTIVSASAGSGKTTVMIEKIIRLIEAGCDVQEILAVTFTKKAASQMKEKLCKALIAALNAPEISETRAKELKKQLSLVPSADISTIHSFCAKLLRSHFYAAGVDNAFRVIGGDDAEGTALKNEALDELLDTGYEEKDEGFLHLLSVYWRKKSDNALRKIFLTTYENLRCRADYREYLTRSGAYDENTFQAVCAELHERLKEKSAYYLRLAEEESAYFEKVGGEAQLSLADELISALTTILKTPDYFAACALEKPKFTPKRSSKKDSDEKKLHIERLATLKTKTAKIYDDELSETLSYAEERESFLCSAKTAAALSAYLLKFDDGYARLKAERGVLDYNDLEHKALALLSNEEIAAAVRGQYRYVFVDEYQDVNPVQEAIVSKISGENLFLVGDVKQSIYGFRGSRSAFFVEKQKQFEKDGSNLKMTRNFRSADAVLDAVNEQFSLAMTPATSAVDYANDSYMERGGRYALNDGRVQLHFLAEEEEKEQKERGVYSVKASTGKREAEESTVAKTIRQIIEKERLSKWYDADAGEYKQVRYQDIAILSRKKQGQIASTVAALAAEGIPVTAAAAVNICDYAEIKTLIDILSLIDNAEQDVPLCSALLSTMGNLTADELANIRLAYKDEKFFRNACASYAAAYEDLTAHKLRKFYGYYADCRREARLLDAGELLTKIISETRMETRLLSKPHGAASVRRIHRFIEETTAGGALDVHAFLQRLKDLNYKIEFSENGGDDSVKVITMHSSKGLEYPVVILDNLNAPFRGVVRDEVFVEEKYGLAPKAFDEKNMTRKSTLLRRLHEKREAESSIADELNLYYVALTRAKYALHLLFKKPSVFPDVRYAKNFADFTDFSVWKKYRVDDELFNVPKQERQALVFHPDEALAQEIMRAFSAKYTHAGYENLPVKSSATALMEPDANAVETERLAAQLYAFDEEIAEDEQELLDEAASLDEHAAKTSVASGLAYHAFLEKFDFSALYAGQKPLKTLVEETYADMDEATRALLSVEQLLKILSNPVFDEVKGMRLFKERQFLVSLPVKDTYAYKAGVDETLRTREDGEEMLFQGAIDLLAVGEDEIRVIDYKYSGRKPEALKKKYRLQLELYRMATAKILQKPKESIRCTLVNIYRGEQVELD